MGILSALFGGGSSKSSAQSGNQAYGEVNSALAPTLGTTANSFNTLNNSLSSYDDYKKNAGFGFGLHQGLEGIGGTAASRGLINSGATGRAMEKFGNDYSDQFYNNWLDKLNGAVGTGAGLAGVLSGAGQYSNSTSSGSQNGGILSSLFSDRRLKKDITRVGTLDNGLPVYSFKYIGPGPAQIGLMADDVELVRPDAVYTHESGYKMVDYGKAVQ